MRLSWKRYVLRFRQPARTSRDVLRRRPVWFIELFDEASGRSGRGECAPLAGLSVDDIAEIEPLLERMSDDPLPYVENPRRRLPEFPAVCFALEMARADLTEGRDDVLFESEFTAGRAGIPINGLIWMGDFDEMRRQVDAKLAEGWGCIKLKIGGIDFDDELRLLSYIRERGGAEIELRVDANGAFGASDVFEKLARLAEFGLHSIEQPVAPGQPELLRELCAQSSVPVALDEELIGGDVVQKAAGLLADVRPHYAVLKPSLLGGLAVCDEVISLAERARVGWWVTSALESNVGLSAIAQWLYMRGFEGWQGLGTGQLFVNNVASRLVLEPGMLWWELTTENTENTEV